MRERLIELIVKTICAETAPDTDCYDCSKHGACNYCTLEGATVGELADHLLANGVIVPPCKVGDEVYRIVKDARPHITKDKVLQIRNDGIEWGVILVGNRYVAFTDFGKIVLTTHDGAEQALKEGAE